MLKVLLAVALAVNAAGPPPLQACADAGIEGPEVVPLHQLVILKASGGPAGVAYDWDVSPSDKASVHEAGPLLVMTGPAGVYTVTLRAISVADGKTTVTKCRRSVTIGPVAPPPKPDATPSPKPEGAKPDPVAATGLIRFGSSGCTATPIWPRRTDGRWDILTATHCVSKVGQRGTLKLRDGRTLNVTVAAFNTTADVCWLTTDAAVESMPYAILAPKLPDGGVICWHNGYGTDRPSNVERGVCLGDGLGDAKIRLRISFSPGDSGGGVFREDDGTLIGVASSTTAFARVAIAYAGSSVAAAKIRPK